MAFRQAVVCFNPLMMLEWRRFLNFVTEMGWDFHAIVKA